MNIKIFQMNECDWFAGRSLGECKKLAVTEFGYSDEDYEEAREISAEEYNTLLFHTDEDRGDITFTERLNELIAERADFPTFFASTEY